MHFCTMLRSMRRLFNFIKKFIFKDTLYCFTYLLFLKQSNYREHAHFLSHEEFLRETDRKSTIRFGDGEIGLIHFSQIHYQKYDPELRKKLLEIINNYNKSSNYIIGLPLYINTPNKEAYKISKEKIFLWIPVKVTFRLLFNKSMSYFDQHIFYRFGRAREFFLEKSKNKKVIVVTRNENISTIKNHPIVSEITTLHFVSCKAENSFSEYERIEDDIRSIIGTTREDYVVFLGCGPAGKIVAYDLSREGILCHDVGLGIEMMLTNENYEHKI